MIELYISKITGRSFSIETNGKSIETPFFVPAISSIKANWDISEYADLIKKIGYSTFLVSAYDIYRHEKREALTKHLLENSSKQIFFLDNGNFEASWYKDEAWNFNKFKDILDISYPDFSFSFDVFWNKDTILRNNIKETVTSIAKTACEQKSGITIALIHSKSEKFPEVVRKIVDNINPEIVAIPERELGSGIFERARVIRTLRLELDKTKRTIPIHVLGAGNPISILMYTLCGADTYDALDWSSAFINPSSGQFLNFSQKDLVDCECEACKLRNIPYEYQVMSHNLLFYLRFMDKIRNAIKTDKINSILDEYLREKDVKQLKKIVDLK